MGEGGACWVMVGLGLEYLDLACGGLGWQLVDGGGSIAGRGRCRHGGTLTGNGRGATLKMSSSLQDMFGM